MTPELDARIAQHTQLISEGSGVFTHATTRQEFVFVPAGAFVMGMTPDELLTVLREIDHDPETDVWRQTHAKAYARARPAHAVTVQAFLCARFPMTGLGVRALEPSIAYTTFDHAEDDGTARLSRAAASHLLDVAGWAAISEAQWEYVARCGGKDTFAGGSEYRDQVYAQTRDTRFKRTACNAWGVWGLALGEWIADADHDDYQGAPTDGAPWGATLGSIRGGGMLHAPWQNGNEAVSCYAGLRGSAHLEHPYVLRPTIALPFLSAKPRLPEVPADRAYDDISARRNLEVRALEKREAERQAVERARREEAQRNIASADVHVGIVRTVGDGLYIIRLADANGILRGTSGRTLAVGDEVRVRVLDSSGTPQLALVED